MTQYCRYCCYLCVGDANYCSEKQQTMSDTVAKSNGFGGAWMKLPKPYEPRLKEFGGVL